MSAALAASYAYCRRVTRSRARNFYFGLCLTPEPKRSSLYAIYAWMRHADDLADGIEQVGVVSGTRGAVGPRDAALDRWTTLTERALRGEAPGEAEPLWPALADTLARYPIEGDWLRAALRGVRADLGGADLATRRELDEYCDRVASTVGLCCVAVWGLRPGADGSHARTLAVEQGRAFQLTNMLRDLGEDLRLNPPRSYLPRESYRAAQLSPEALLRWTPPDRCAAFVRGWVRQAERGYDAADELATLLSPDCRPVHGVMTRIYRGVLERIDREPRVAVGHRPAGLPMVVKAGLAISGAVRARLAPRRAPAEPGGARA